MMSYCEISVLSQSIYGIGATVLSVAAVFEFVMVCVWHMGRRYQVSAVILFLVNMVMLQELSNVACLLESGQEFTPVEEIIGHLPSIVVALFFVMIALLEGIFGVVLWKKKKNMFTYGAIKESLDALPDGVCFFASDGQPLLVNTQMNRISGELFHTEILNARLFWIQLKGKLGKKIEGIICTRPTVIVRTGDGKIWEFHRNVLKAGSSQIHEMLAYDITKQYELARELDERNQKLGRINERLQLYSREVERITAENEILTAKIQVHDNVGRSLLAFRSYLMQPEEERDRNSLLFLWRYTIAVLRNEAVVVPQNNDWELLLQAAQAVDVEIVRKGKLPEHKTEREIIIAALHECLTNTVKHANGNKLYVSICCTETMVAAEFTNNGIRPSGTIQETGGLKNLRHTVETAGGIMKIENNPHFVLRIELLRGDRVWEK